jgi:hypothetical protein
MRGDYQNKVKSSASLGTRVQKQFKPGSINGSIPGVLKISKLMGTHLHRPTHEMEGAGRSGDSLLRRHDYRSQRAGEVAEDWEMSEWSNQPDERPR